ncbi:hypothetical protein AB0N19_21565, partial [Streptomyces sp. NPDC051132]
MTDASQGEDGPVAGGRGEEPSSADETLHLRVDALRADETMQLRVPAPPEPPAPGGGRAERRRGARAGGRDTGGAFPPGSGGQSGTVLTTHAYVPPQDPP